MILGGASSQFDHVTLPAPKPCSSAKMTTLHPHSTSLGLKKMGGVQGSSMQDRGTATAPLREISEDRKPGKHVGKYCSHMWKSPPFSPPDHKGIPVSDILASPPALVSRNLGETSSQPPNPYLCLLCVKRPEPWECLPNTSQNCWVLSREHWGWGPGPPRTGEHIVSYGKMQRGSPFQLPE